MRLLVRCRLAPCASTRRDAVLNGVKVITHAGDWFESYSPGSLVLPRRGATVELDHDAGQTIGHVVAVAGSGKWIEADLVVESEDPAVLERIRPGVGVSLGGQSLASDDNLVTRVRTHTLCALEHVAITRRGQIAAFPGAEIVSVRESKTTAKPAATTSSGTDWRSQLPPGYAGFRDTTIDLQPGDELLLGSRTSGARWDGEKFHVAGSHARAA